MSGTPPYNLLYGLRFRESTQIVNCALPGDTIVNMSRIVHNRHFREALTTPGFKWKAIFLSGGGNDLIDRADEILIPESERDPAASATKKSAISDNKRGPSRNTVEAGS